MANNDNLKDILDFQSYNKNLDDQMNNDLTLADENDVSNIPIVFTKGTTPDILNRIRGEFCVCEFIIGSDTMVTKSGIMYNVGLSYFTLYNITNNEYVVCDIYSLKFITVPRKEQNQYIIPSQRQRKNRRY